MAELESAIEKSLIDKLCHDKSQWTYRADIKTEEQLWNNFKYILEQNNKAKLNDVPLSESEFAKIKNDISHASFYEAGKWLVGENGKVYVHIQRGNEMLHLLVMNNEHICGGTSVYEVINQYQAFATGEDEDIRNRRFDVTLLINGSDGPVVNDYDLIAYHKIKIDFEYLVELLQGFVDSLHPETNNQKQSDFQDKIKEIREMVNEFSQSNQKMGNLLSIIVEEIENDSRKYFRQDISAIINRRRYEAINKEIFAFAKKWFISPEEVWYHVQHFQNGIIANKTNLKKAAQYSEYKVSTEHPMTKLQFNQSIVKEFKNELMENILPLLR